MSKHLRFGKLLGMLAFVLTLSFAWSQAQNTSSAKQLLTFGFTTAANSGAALGSDVTGTINQTTRTVALTVPFQADVTALKATFTSSPFSNVFGGVATPTGSAAVSGTSPALNYTSAVTWTVEAENFSFENYVVTVTKAAASTAKDMLTFSGAWAKPWTGPCTAPTNGVYLQTEPGTFSGTNITFPVPYGSNLDALTIYFTVSPWATASLTTFTAYDFDADNNGVPEAKTLTVTSQSGATQAYSILPVVGPASVLDNLLAFTVATAGSTVTINHTTQTIAVTVPYSTTTFAPAWTVSPYAHMFSDDIFTSMYEICSGASYTLTTSPQTFEFWIQAEDPSEESQYVVTVTKDAASTVNTISAITGTFSKTSACGYDGPATTGDIVGAISGGTVTFAVPYGVTSLKISAMTKTSSLSTTSVVVGTTSVSNTGTFTVTSESGVVKTYTVAFTTGTASNAKQLITFGFKQTINASWGFTWPAGATYVGVVDQTLRKVLVTVPFNTDLHNLKAYFTNSDYSCVFIAESNGSYTPQSTDVTPNDHSNTLTYMVRAEDGTQERYEVMVVKEAMLTGNDLIGFKVTGLPYCYGGYFETAGTYTGTNIAVSVKYGTNLTALAYSFTYSAGATVSPAVGTANFSSPVTFTVTSQAGVAKTYTVTVTPRALNEEKKLLSYWFDGTVNSGLGLNAVGTVNEAAKTVMVWIPWDYRANITSLKASFTLSTNAQMTHSEDTQILQVSGTTANDFTTPVAYTVWAENCSSVEYFVTVNVIPNTNTGISAFTFASTGCGVDLVNKIDPYARRIYITLPYTMDITNLAPYSVVVTPGATVTVANTNPVQSWSTAKDWTKGPVTYTVTAPDGVTKANWTVYVANPASKEAKITSWSFASGQIGSAVIDNAAHTVTITIASGTNLRNMTATIGLSCGATICCNMGACAGTTIDFSDNLCHTCVITAQDQTVTQDWTVCLKYQDVTIPEVTTWSVMAYNCTDSVAVQSNELGRVFIVNESAINMLAAPKPVLAYYNLSDWNTTSPVAATAVANLVAARLGAWATVTAVNTPVYVKTNGLYSGTYWAFSVDASGNISCISTQKLYLDMCDVEVATLCDLRNQPVVWRYTLTEEIFVTYEETRGSGNIKFLQNATCGIEVKDKLGALPATYGVGTGVKGLKGMLDDTGNELMLIPICCYTPTKGTTGNVVTPIDLTYEQFNTSVYSSRRTYESMLVRITTPMIVANDYGQGPNWVFDNLDLSTRNTQGTVRYYVQSVFNSPLIGTPTTTIPAYYTGVRTNINWGSVSAPSWKGFITPRKAADIVPVSGPILTYLPNPVSIEGVLPGNCKAGLITIYNEGATLVVNNVTISGVANITALYLDDRAAVDGFNLVTPPAVPFTIAPWANQVVRVDFCPTASGDKTTNLVVEYGVGKTLVIPINGKTMVINAMDYLQNFNTLGASSTKDLGQGWTTREGNEINSGDATINDLSINISYSWVNYDGTNVVNMRPRKKVAGARIPGYIISPGVLVTGNDPVLAFVETNASVVNDGPYGFSPRSIYLSTNGGSSWTLLDSYVASALPNAFTGGGWRSNSYSLAAYKGQNVWVKFEVGSVANEYTYWCIDNFAIQERISTPLITGAPNPGEFGGVQVAATGTIAFNIKNTGISVLKVKKVEVVGAAFKLTDTNTYPFEVTAASGAWAYTVGNSGAKLDFSVAFMPTDIGVKTGKIVVTYGLYSDMTYEIPLSGEGLSCYTATAATKGENWAPSQNTWFKYTADKFSIVEVNSCHVHQTDPGAYSWDTFLYIYKNCEGDLIASHDDMEKPWCPYNRASSSITTVVNAGETIYIFWPLAFPTSLHAYDGFYFNVNVTYPLEGDVCENAIPLTLPVVNHFGTTVGFNDDYDQSPCSPFSNYMDGNDKVYTITVAATGYLTGSILGAYGSIHVLDMCPKEELTKDHCKAFVGGPNGGTFTHKKLTEGTYYVIVSTWAPPQTVDYLLNMSWESSSAVENGDLMSNLRVFPNPTNGKFTVSYSNSEASDMTFELVNISGQVVYRNEVKAAYSYNDEIDASQFAKGVYYLKVNNGKEVKIEKVVVQ